MDVIGASPDTPAAQQAFREKYDLTVRLLADRDRALAEAFGCDGRSTFLVGSDGLIRNVWLQVKVPGHVDAVLAAAREHSAS